jgi:hypothetical protein
MGILKNQRREADAATSITENVQQIFTKDFSMTHWLWKMITIEKSFIKI